MAIKTGRRLLVWTVLSLGLLLLVSVLFAAKGVAPGSRGGTGEATAYSVFLTVLYLLDVICLCCIAGMKENPGFLVAEALVSGLMLAFPGYWAAPFYGLSLRFSQGTAILRGMAGGTFLLCGGAFFLGRFLRKTRGCGVPAKPEPVPPLLEEEDDCEDKG